MENADKRFTIEELSRKYLINTSSLKSVFKMIYGMPVAAYMKDYRMKKAMKMLRETDDSVAEIAERVGYGTQGKFTKAFKESVKAFAHRIQKNVQETIKNGASLKKRRRFLCYFFRCFFMRSAKSSASVFEGNTARAEAGFPPPLPP